MKLHHRLFAVCCFGALVLGAEEEKAGIIPDWTWAQNVAEEGSALRYPAWIWLSDAPGKELNKRYFSYRVEIPAGAEIATAWLRATADNVYILSVNGQSIGSDEWWQSVEYWDIKPYLKEGSNLITVEAWDFGGACGLYLFGAIDYKGGSIEIKTDANWDCTLAPAPDWLTTGAGENTRKAQIVQEGVAPDTDVIDWEADQPERIAAFIRLHLDEKEHIPFPRPQLIQPNGTPVRLPWELNISTTATEAEFAAAQLGKVLQALDPQFTPGNGTLVLELSYPADRDAFPEQGYRIVVDSTAKSWRIEAIDRAGFIYGVWSFLQLVGRDNGAYTIQPVLIEDFPDVKLRGIVDGQLTPEMFDWMSFYKINAIKLYLNYTVPPSPVVLKQLREYAENRGIHLIPCLHPPTLFSFQPNSEDMQFLMNRIAEISELGFRELCILQDDYPNETAGADCETYGKGLEGLVLAQSYMMREITSRFGKEFDRLIFMPRVYFDPQVMGPYPAVDGYPGHLAYREKLGDYNLFPAELEMYTTRGNPEYTRKLRQITGRRSHVFQNYNEAALAGFQMHFEPYPVVPRQILDDICGLWLNGADSPMPFRYWYVNYLTFAENTWNIDAPVGLEAAFAEQYGPAHAARLSDYAELMGGHRNIVGTMEDFWWLPKEFATRVLHDEVNLADPTPQDLRRFAAKGANCRAALQLILDSDLPHEVKDELGSHSIRLGNLFEIKVLIGEIRELVAQMENLEPAKRRPLADRAQQLIDEGIAKARVSQEIIRKMRLFYTAIVPDYSYVGYFRQLLKNEVENALNNTNCVRNGNFELQGSTPDGKISRLEFWKPKSIRNGQVKRGDTPAMSGKSCLTLRPDESGNPESCGLILSDPFECTGGTLEWAQAAQKGGAVQLTLRILDDQGNEVLKRDFSPASSQFAMERIDISQFKGRTIRLEFSATTREKGMGWSTWLDAVAIR